MRNSSLCCIPVLMTLILVIPTAATGQTGIEEPIWASRPEELPTRLEVVEGGLLLGTGPSRITSWDVTTGGTRWWMPTEGAASIRLLPVGVDRVLVMRDLKGRYSVDVVDDGSREALWGTGRRQGEVLEVLAEPTGERVFLLERSPSGEGRILCLSAGDGRRLWETGAGPIPPGPEAGIPVGTSRMILRDGVLYRSDGGEVPPAVSGHDAASGDLRWLAFMPEGERVPGLVDHPAGLFAVGDGLMRLDETNGARSWRLQGTWVPGAWQRPWILVEDPGNLLVQLVHGTTGEARWRRPADPDLLAPRQTVWTQDGIVVAGSDGAAARYDVASGRRADQHGPRMTYDRGRDPTRLWGTADGLLQVRGNSRTTVILRLDGRGGIAWEQELGPPVQFFATPEEGAERLFAFTPGGRGGAGVVWAAVMQEGDAVLMGMDAGTGELVIALPVLRDGVVFAVDGDAERVYFLTPERRLAAAGY